MQWKQIRPWVFCILVIATAYTVIQHLWRTNYPHIAKSLRWNAVSCFRAGDLILSSNENFLTCTLGGSYWNHVAIVYEEPETRVLYVWEVCNPPVGWVAFASTREHRSTRLSPLYRFFERNSRKRVGSIGYRPLQGPPVDAKQFSDFIKRRWGQAFAYDYIAQGANRFFGAFGTVPVESRTVNGPRYCAELAAETYEHLGVLNFSDSPFTPHETVPSDFCAATERIPLSREYSFGQEVFLVAPKKTITTDNDLKQISLDSIMAADQ